MKYLHIMSNSTFTRPFINFIKENFDFEDHMFMISDGDVVHKFEIEDNEQKNIFILNSEDFTYLNLYKYYIQIISSSKSVDKIFIHGLYRHKLMLVLFLAPWILKKYYWIIWGSDLYDYRVRKNNIKSFILEEVIKKSIVKKFGGIIAYNQAEYDLARKWYKTKTKFYQSFYYTSNLYEELPVMKKNTSTVYIQIGNSADPGNNHIEVLEKIERYKDKDIKIIVPLSYGDKELKYTNKLIKIGKNMFAEKFVPVTDFLPYNKYLQLLGKIDIAIFNHNRQQAMGNITTLLGLGKKVYMRNDITSFKLFDEIGIKVFDINNIELTLLDEKTIYSNKEKIKNYFSKENLLKQWQNILKS